MIDPPNLPLSDDDSIDQRVAANIGESMAVGLLRSREHKVIRARVRNALRSSDPLSRALRWPGITKRRVYSVAGPNSLWHIGMTLTCMGNVIS